MSRAAILALAGVLLLVAAGGIGYAWRGSHNQQAVATAQANTAVCDSALAANKAVTDALRAQLAELRQRHESALAAARDALDMRDAEIQRLNTTAARAAAELRKTANEQSDCAALARLPVCAAIADRLWPVAADADRDAH